MAAFENMVRSSLDASDTSLVAAQIFEEWLMFSEDLKARVLSHVQWGTCCFDQTCVIVEFDELPMYSFFDVL